MDAQTILEIQPALTAFLHELGGCFCQARTRAYLEVYVAGQLSDLDRKSVGPITDAAGVPPRSLQEFLSLFKWDEAALRDRLQRRCATGCNGAARPVATTGRGPAWRLRPVGSSASGPRPEQRGRD